MGSPSGVGIERASYTRPARRTERDLRGVRHRGLPLLPRRLRGGSRRGDRRSDPRPRRALRGHRRRARARDPVPDRHAHPRRSLLGHAPDRARARRAGRDAPREPGAVRRPRGAGRRLAHARHAADRACCTRPDTPPTRCASCCPTACSRATRCCSARSAAPICRPATPRRSGTACTSSCSCSIRELLVHPGHNYKSAPPTTLAEQRATNPRLADARPRGVRRRDDARATSSCRATSPRRCAPTHRAASRSRS